MLHVRCTDRHDLLPCVLPRHLLQPASVITLPANTKVLLRACALQRGATYKQIVVPPGSEVGAGGAGRGWVHAARRVRVCAVLWVCVNRQVARGALRQCARSWYPWLRGEWVRGCVAG